RHVRSRRHRDRRLRRRTPPDAPQHPAAVRAHDRDRAVAELRLGRGRHPARPRLQRLPPPACLRPAHGRRPFRLRRSRRALPLGQCHPGRVRPRRSRLQASAAHARRAVSRDRGCRRHPPLGRPARGAARLARRRALRPGDAHRVGRRLRRRRALHHEPRGPHARRCAHRRRQRADPPPVGGASIARLGGRTAALPRGERRSRRYERRRCRTASHRTRLARRACDGSAHRTLTARSSSPGGAVKGLLGRAAASYRGVMTAPTTTDTAPRAHARRNTHPTVSIFVLLASIALATGIGLLGSLATMSHVEGWYADADTAPWSPPDIVFGPVWTALYLMMAVAAWLVWRRRQDGEVRPALVAYIVQL